MKRFLAALIILLLAAVSVAVTVHVLVNRSNLREDLIAAVKRETGRDLTVSDLAVQVLPWPTVSARNVTLSDLTHATATGAASRSMVDAKELRASVALLPLLWREIRITDLVLMRGHVQLWRTADGVSNWQFTPVKSEVPSRETVRTSPKAYWKVVVQSAKLNNITFDLTDHFKRVSGSIHIQQAELYGLNAAAPYLKIQAERNNIPFQIEGHIGPLKVLRGEMLPWPVSLGGSIGSETKKTDWFAFDGQIRDMRQLRGFSGIMRGEMKSVSNLGALFPHANLPDLRNVGGEIGIYDSRSDGEAHEKLPAHLGVNHVHLHFGSARLASGIGAENVHIDAETLASPLTLSGRLKTPHFSVKVLETVNSLAQAQASWQSHFKTPLAVHLELRDATEPRLSSELRLVLEGVIGSDQTRLEIKGNAARLAVGNTALNALSLGGVLSSHAGASTVRLDNLVLKSREMALSADLSATPTVPTTIEGRIHLVRADLDKISGLWLKKQTKKNALLVSAKQVEKKWLTTESNQAPPSPRRPWFADFRPNLLLRKINGQLDLTGEAVRFAGDTYSDLHAHARFDHQGLILDPITGVGNGAHFSGAVSYDFASMPHRLVLTFSPFMVPATIAERVLNCPGIVRGPLMLVGQLHGEGDSREKLIASLTGHLGLSMVGGSISAQDLGRFLGPQARALLGDQVLPLRCVGLHAHFAPEVTHIDSLGLDAASLSLMGEGTYRSSDRALALELTPHVVVGNTVLSTPLRVSGTLEQPIVQQATNNNKRFELTIGGPDSDKCGSILDAGREGMAGPAAAPPAEHKNVKPVTILRQLGLFK